MFSKPLSNRGLGGREIQVLCHFYVAPRNEPSSRTDLLKMGSAPSVANDPSCIIQPRLGRTFHHMKILIFSPARDLPTSTSMLTAPKELWMRYITAPGNDHLSDANRSENTSAPSHGGNIGAVRRKRASGTATRQYGIIGSGPRSSLLP